MKAIYSIFLMVAAVALLALSVPVHASQVDDASNQPPGTRMCSKPTFRVMISKSGPGTALLPDGNCLRRIPQVVSPGDRGWLARVEAVDNRLEVKGETPG